MRQSQKDKIYELILENKFKIFNRKNKEELFVEFLNTNNIKFNFHLNIENVVKYLKNINDKCGNTNCINKRIFIGIRTSKRYEHGFQKYCSEDCRLKMWSSKQMGINNTCHRMTEETIRSMSNKLSKSMKDRILSGSFTPCITNSWSGSKVFLNINSKRIEYRSSWEAFFHLCNPLLEYEKVRIPYSYKERDHSYIVDFSDNFNKILYEVKPNSCKKSDRVESKLKYSNSWCLKNGYKYIFIDDEWFKLNFIKNLILLKNQDCGDIIKKRLNKFNENKKY